MAGYLNCLTLTGTPASIERAVGMLRLPQKAAPRGFGLLKVERPSQNAWRVEFSTEQMQNIDSVARLAQAKPDLEIQFAFESLMGEETAKVRYSHGALAERRTRACWVVHCDGFDDDDPRIYMDDVRYMGFVSDPHECFAL